MRVRSGLGMRKLRSEAVVLLNWLFWSIPRRKRVIAARPQAMYTSSMRGLVEVAAVRKLRLGSTEICVRILPLLRSLCRMIRTPLLLETVDTAMANTLLAAHPPIQTVVRVQA